MKYEQNGFVFTDEKEPAIMLNKYLQEKGIKGIVLLAENEQESAIVLFDAEGIPFFSSTKAEDIAVHIDIMALDKQLEK